MRATALSTRRHVNMTDKRAVGTRASLERRQRREREIELIQALLHRHAAARAIAVAGAVDRHPRRTLVQRCIAIVSNVSRVLCGVVVSCANVRCWRRSCWHRRRSRRRWRSRCWHN
jgi:hypothetical protein